MSSLYRGRAGAYRAGRQNGYSSGRQFSNRGRGGNRSAFQPSHLDRACYVHAAVETRAEEEYKAVHTFIDFALEPRLQKNVEYHGYATPTPIQDQAIPVLMEGKDVVGIANTSTGKTAAFLLPLIHKVVSDLNQGVLILAPTRELALQIHEEFLAFAHGLPISVSLCIGGANIQAQIHNLRNNPHFVIGTPGRIKDLINRNMFHTEMFANVVLDEVDRMLDIGFRRDIQYLLSKLSPKRQSAFFSATMNRETEEIMRNFLTNPVHISIKKTETSQHISQDIVRVRQGENKIDVLHNLLKQPDFKKVIIFGRTKHGINKLEEELFRRGFGVSAIHGNKTQGARQRSLQEFKRGRVQALLATDIAARGIDVADVTHVINYDEPQSYQDYVHRIGRTGRAGKIGKALTFVS